MTHKLAVAALAAAALAVQIGIFNYAVAAPLASAVGQLRENAARANAPTFEESITVVAAHAPKAKVAKRS